MKTWLKFIKCICHKGFSIKVPPRKYLPKQYNLDIRKLKRLPIDGNMLQLNKNTASLLLHHRLIIIFANYFPKYIYKWKKMEVTFWKKKVSNFQIFSKSPNMRVYHPKNTFWWYYWAYMSYIQLLRQKIFCRRGVRGAHTEKSRFQKIEVTYFFFPLWKLLTFFSTCRIGDYFKRWVK